MLKNILKLEGAQKLSKNEQKSINGGAGTPQSFGCHTYFYNYCITTEGACTNPKTVYYCGPCCAYRDYVQAQM
jgi:hypothetical protein